MITQEENKEINGAGMRLPIKKRFTAKRLALMAVFVALAYVVSILEIPMPIFGAVFLNLDFGNVFIMLIAFVLGPIEGMLVCLMKEGLRCFSSMTACTGEIANFLITTAFILLPSIVYQYRRNLKTVCWTLLSACLIATVAACVANRLLIFPAFALALGGDIFGMTVEQAFAVYWPALVVFNLIKTVSISALTLLMYKRLSNFLKKIKI